MNDSVIYKVTLVVAVPNYTGDFNAVQQMTAMDFMIDALSNNPEVTILDTAETRLELWKVTL